MPVTIQFDTLKDLENFMSGRDVSVVATTRRGGAGRPKAAAKSKPSAAPTGRRGRPPKAASGKASDAPAKRGRPPKAASGKTAAVAKGGKGMKAAPAKKRGPKPKMAPGPKSMAAKGRPRTGDSLTSKIQDAIQKFIDQKQAFTANDVYAEVARRNRDVNKQSVITSVLKQMKSTYQHINVSERPGAGPRPVKVYQA